MDIDWENKVFVLKKDGRILGTFKTKKEAKERKDIIEKKLKGKK